MSETEKKSNTNAKFIQEIRRGDKEIDEIKPIVNYCTMPAELKSDAIEKIREAMSKIYYKSLFNISFLLQELLLKIIQIILKHCQKK